MPWDENPYYQPEKFGLVIVAEIDDPDASWSFDKLVLWRHVETGDLYYAQDSGCSCPSPFEDISGLDGLSTLTDNSWREFEAAVNDWCESNVTYGYQRDATLMARHEMLMAGAKALRA